MTGIILQTIWSLSVVAWACFQYRVVKDIRENNKEKIDKDNIKAWICLGIMWVALLLMKIL